MRAITSIVIIALLAFAGLQTHAEATERKVTLRCAVTASTAEDCVSFGPLGGIRPSGVRFWAANFVDECVQAPVTLGDEMVARVRSIAL